jgi:hypothetical protein
MYLFVILAAKVSNYFKIQRLFYKKSLKSKKTR